MSDECGFHHGVASITRLRLRRWLRPVAPRAPSCGHTDEIDGHDSRSENGTADPADGAQAANELEPSPGVPLYGTCGAVNELYLLPPPGARCDRRRKMYGVSGTQHVGRSQCCCELGEGLIDGSKVEAPEQCRQSLDLGHGAVTHRLREQLRDQEDRTDTGDCTGRRRRFDGEEVAHPSSQRVAGCGHNDQDIGIEGILRRLVTG